MKDLSVNLIGVIEDASSLPQDIKRILRGNQSIQVIQDRQDNEKWFARVTFLKKEDGSFISPTTALTEKDMTYFLIQVVNTCRNSTILVETGAKDKPKNIWVDEQEIQSCDIGGGVGTLIRVHINGQTEILRISSSVINNKKEIDIFSLFEGNLPFEDEAVLKVMMSSKKILSQFEEDIKNLHDSLNEPRERFEKNNLDLSEAKAHLIQNQDGTQKKIEPETKHETPLEEKKEEIVETPKEKEKELIKTPPDPEPGKPKSKPKEKKVTKRNPDEKKANNQKKKVIEEAEKKEAEAEINDSIEKISPVVS